tara:strand:- start:381 stop:1868 length:1488 start_codon:yes stop_codon:yes gene_type:complete
MANQLIPFTKMSPTKNRPLFVGNILQKIVVQHWYYRDNKCTDIELIPTDRTQRLLRKYALKIKSLGNEYQIISLKELSSDIISQMSQETLKFYMKLKNPYFTNFTALLEKQHPRSYYFFQQDSQGIKQEEVVMVSTIFEWTFKTIQSITELKLHDADENKLKTIDLVDEDGSYHVSIDMHPYEAGMYSLTSSDSKIKVFLLNAAGISSIPSLFGLLEFNLNGDKANVNTKQLQFYSKKIRWQYNLYKSNQYSSYEDTLDDMSSDSSNSSISWDGFSNIESGGTPKNIRSTLDGSWGDSGAYASESITTGEDAFISGIIASNEKEQAIGFSTKVTPTYHYNEMYVGLLFGADGTLAIIENGYGTATNTSYEEGDTFCIIKVGPWAYYEKNGQVLGRFGNPINQNLSLLIAITSGNAGFSDVYLHNFSSELPEIQFTKTNISEKTAFKSDRWIPYKQQPRKILELTLTDPQDQSEILSIPLPNPSALKLENQIDINI